MTTDHEVINNTIEYVKDCISKFDVPEARKNDLRWLSRNLWIHNRSEDVQFGASMPKLRDEISSLKNELMLKMELMMQEQRIRLCV